jgi:hypothetical protein
MRSFFIDWERQPGNWDYDVIENGIRIAVDQGHLQTFRAMYEKCLVMDEGFLAAVERYATEVRASEILAFIRNQH